MTEANSVSFFPHFSCILCSKVPNTKNDISFFKEDIKLELEDISVP